MRRPANRCADDVDLLTPVLDGLFLWPLIFAVVARLHRWMRDAMRDRPAHLIILGRYVPGSRLAVMLAAVMPLAAGAAVMVLVDLANRRYVPRTR